MPEPGTPVPRPRRRRAAEAPHETPAPQGNGAEADVLTDPGWKRYRSALEELRAARRVILEAPHPRLEFEIAADRERMRQAELVVDVTSLGLGFRVTAAEGIDMTLTRLRESRGDLSAELEVRRYGNHLFRARMNLSSGTARAATARILDQHPAGKEVDWREVLEQSCIGILDQQRAGEPWQQVGQLPMQPEPPRVIAPFLPAGPTLLWAPQGVGKSTIAGAVVVELETSAEVLPGWHPVVEARCLVLDWEASAGEWNDRIRRIADGAGVEAPQVLYRRPRRPLADQVEEIAIEIDRHHIGFLVIDSVEKAAGARGEAETYEAKAERLFVAIDRLGVPCLLIDHVAGEDFRKSFGGPNAVTPKSIGSTLKGAWARATYDLKRDPDRSTGNRVEMVLHNVKVNQQRALAPYEFVVVYDGDEHTGPIRFEESRLTSPELLASLPLRDRVWRILANAGRSLPVKELAEEAGTTQGTIRSLVGRDERAGQARRFNQLPDKTVSLLARGQTDG